MRLLIRMNTPARHRKWFYEVHFRSWGYKKTTRTSATSVSWSPDIPLVLLAQATVRVLRLWFGTVSLLTDRGQAFPEMDWLSHQPQWHRPDPIALRRYLEVIRQQGLPRAQAPPTRFVHTNDSHYQMTHQSKKKRIDEETLPADAGTKPIQLQRRRVWRACESCRCVVTIPVNSRLQLTPIDHRRKKIKCDGCEPTCAQCQASGSQCTWLQTKDRAALSRQYAILFQSNLFSVSSTFQLCTGTRGSPLAYGVTVLADNTLSRAIRAVPKSSYHFGSILYLWHFHRRLSASCGRITGPLLQRWLRYAN